MPRARYHHGDLKRAALAEAVRQVEAEGHAAFSMDRLARALGVTPAALYRHYADRSALLRAVIWEGFHRFVAAVEGAALTEPDPRARLRAVAVAYVRFALENPGWFRLQFSQAGVSEHAIPHEEVELRYPEAIFAALGEVLADPGLVERGYLLLWGAMHGIASLSVERVHPDLETDAQRLARAEALIDTLIDALGALGERRRGS